MSLSPTHQEVADVLKALINNNSPRLDGLPAKTLKYGGDAACEIMLQSIVQVWESEDISSLGKNSKILTIFKNKGKRTVCENGRSIFLLSYAGKVLTKIMLRRLMAHVSENILPETQRDFRSNRGTVDMIFVARQIQEKGCEQN